MQKLLLPLLLFLGCSLTHAQPAPPYLNIENGRSDTIDILKYTIRLELGTTASPTIGGVTHIRLAPRVNGQTAVRLDLLKMTIDSIKEGPVALGYQYNDTLLKVNFTAPKNTTDTSVISVWYHGPPQIDASGWGGFYFDNTQGAQYVFNLGVGFAAKPHNYGRPWFPCFDNFKERSRFEFEITTDSSRKAFCGGLLVSDVVNGAQRTRTWILNEEIPSYLASVAAAAYSPVTWTVNTLNGPKPVIIAAHASDTTAAKNAFVNFNNCLAGFENYFGPYRWSRAGYALVPFNGGAMEHAANIAFPRAPGLLNSEELMSHEFAHHWWGNLITCETPEDMWINEGMATLSAHLFFEWQYGKTKYLERIKTQHEDLLHFLHKREGGFLAISGLGHDLTYSDHVYRKGAIAGHTLRGYMGDAAFFAACKYVMQQKAFQSINSNELRDLMQTSSGLNLQDFFNDWIYNGGWPHFAIDSVRYSGSGSAVTAKVSIRQKLYGAASLYKNVPLEISFFKPDRTRTIKTAVMNGAAATFTFALNFTPAYCALNYDAKVSDATSFDTKELKAAGAHAYPLGKATVYVTQTGADSSLVRVVHNFVAPDPFKQNPWGHRLSNQHYWRLEGLLSPGLQGRLRLVYDGTKGTTGATTYLDTLLTVVNGDSVALFYRRHAGDDWSRMRAAKKVVLTAKTGYFETDSLRPGEYAFGNLGDTTIQPVAIHEPARRYCNGRVYPNPATQFITLEIDQPPAETFQVTFYDTRGQVALRTAAAGGTTRLDLSSLCEGSYQVEVKRKDRTVFTTKILVE